MTTEHEYCQNVVNATLRFEAAFQLWLAQPNAETARAVRERLLDWKASTAEFEGRFDFS